MGDFKNGIGMKIFTSLIAIGIIAINIYFVAQSTSENLPNLWYAYFGVGVAAIIYFCFILYLAIYLFICLGWEDLVNKSWVKKFYNVEEFLIDDKQGKASELQYCK